MATGLWIAFAALSSLTVGILAQGNVTLESITIFRTHEWLGQKPSLYFQCKDESKVELPDVRQKDHVYTFAGHESWQPLTEISGKKCKRCGLYEKNEVLKDGVFDEWEFCPDGFGKQGRYIHFKDGEFNATFLSSEQKQSEAGTPVSNSGETPEAGSGRTVITFVVVLFCFLFVAGVGVVGYVKWQKKRREEQQARFMKLFEEDDDFDRELGL